MGKLLLLVAVLFVGVAVLRVLVGARKKAEQADIKNTKSSTNNSTTDPANKPPALLPCLHCGVHMAATDLAEHQHAHHG